MLSFAGFLVCYSLWSLLDVYTLQYSPWPELGLIALAAFLVCCARYCGAASRRPAGWKTNDHKMLIQSDEDSLSKPRRDPKPKHKPKAHSDANLQASAQRA